MVVRWFHRSNTGSPVTGLTMSAGPIRSGSMIGDWLRCARAACHWLRWSALARHGGSLALSAIQYVTPVLLCLLLRGPQRVEPFRRLGRR